MDQTSQKQSQPLEVSLINLALSEEIEALNSIYGEDTLCVLNAKADRIETLFRLPAPSPADQIAFYLYFPCTYPESPPEYCQADVELHQSLDRRIQNIGILIFLYLRKVFRTGDVCIFDLIDHILPILACMEDHDIRPERSSEDYPQLAESDWRWASRAFINMSTIRDVVECFICCDEDYTFKMITLPCNHHYCFDCFQTGWDLAAKAMDPYTCCQRRIPLKTIQSYTTMDDEQACNYTKMLIDRDTPNPFYCGQRDCAMLIGEISVWKLSRGSTKHNGIKCPKCKRFTCPRCRDALHNGMCLTDNEMLELFKKADIRRCPKCGDAIEKNGGCSHMQCRTCRSHYTWMSNGTMGRYDGPIYDLHPRP